MRLFEGEIAAVELAGIHEHFARCGACRELASALARNLSQPTQAAGEPSSDSAATPSATELAASISQAAFAELLPAGTQVGRFIVSGRLGAGGMGVVHAAADPVLGRKVALKLLRSDSASGAMSEQWSVRLLQEARALAQLSHPNVITVHDVGVHGDQLFVAMEMIDGSTLRSWLAKSPRSWREVAFVFLAAGRGLAAAHRAGLVHRDFKPDNVLIGRDGQVRVTDFGLARTLAVGSSHGAELAPAALPGPVLAALNAHLIDREKLQTRTGAIVGTPGYIAPEVLCGGTADVASDQFSFCVAFYEALFGELPFRWPSVGDSPAREIRARYRAIPEPPHRRAVPEWLKKIVERGLSAQPEQRFPDLESLLAALGQGSARAPRWRLAAGAIAVVACAAIGGLLAVNREADETCTGGRAQIAAVWNPVASAAMHASLAATARPHAWASADRVAARIDAYTDQWATMHRAACQATARGEQSAVLLDRQLICLGRRLDQVGALIDLLARRADDKAVDNAIAMAGDLEPLASCADTPSLLSRTAPPVDPVLRERLAELERQTDRAKLERRAGRLQAAADTARAVLDAEKPLAYPPLAARAEAVLGLALEDLGKPAEAREALLRAQRLAERAGDMQLAVDMMLDMLVVVGMRQERYREAEVIAQLIEAALERPDLRGDALRRSRLLGTLGAVAKLERNFDRAIELARETLALRRRVLPPISEEIAAAEEGLGNALIEKNGPEARTHFTESLAIRQQFFGRDHPIVANVHINLGVTYLDVSDLEPARKHLLDALAILEKAPSFRNYQTLLNNLGVLEEFAGNYERARRYFETALTERQRQFGPSHPLVGNALRQVAVMIAKLGDPGHALELHRRALDILEKTVGAAHLRYAVCLSNIGEDLRLLGRPAESLDYHKRAIAILEAKGESTGNASIPLGLALLDLGRRHDAIAALTHGHKTHVLGRIERADAAFALARALSPGRPTSPRSRELAEEALATYTARLPRERPKVIAYLAAGK